MECGPAHSDGDKGWEGVGVEGGSGEGLKKKKKRERERGMGKKAEKKNKFTRSIHLLLA